MLTLKELQQKVKAEVIGQDDAVDALCVIVFKYLLRSCGKDFGIYFNSPLIALLCGKTGHGKTYLIQTICECAGVPFVNINSKQIVQDGWSGQSFAELLHVNKFSNKGIIVLDEFDKLTEPLASSSSDNINKHIQMSLLKYFEGTSIVSHETANRVKITFLDLTNCMFILAGAFVSTTNDNKKVAVGFTGENNKSAILKAEDFVKCGLLPEIAGRVTEYIQLQSINEMVYQDIINHTSSINTRYSQLLAKLDIEFAVDSNEAIKEAVKLELGVRGLIQAIEKQVTKTILLNINKIDLEKLSGIHPDFKSTEKPLMKLTDLINLNRSS